MEIQFIFMVYIDAELTRRLSTHVFFLPLYFVSCVLFLWSIKELSICHISEREFGVIFSLENAQGLSLIQTANVVHY